MPKLNHLGLSLSHRETKVRLSCFRTEVLVSKLSVLILALFTMQAQRSGLLVRTKTAICRIHFFLLMLLWLGDKYNLLIEFEGRTPR